MDQQNARINAENDVIRRENERNELANKDYRKRVIEPAAAQVDRIAGQLRAEEVGMLSSLRTSCIEYSLWETKIKIKDTPLNRQRIEGHKQASLLQKD